MTEQLLTIESAGNKSLKHMLKLGLGQAFAVVCKERAARLADKPTSYPANFKDRMLMAFLKERARVENNSSFFERLHLDFWKGQGGKEFSSNCEYRFEDLYLKQQAEDFELLTKIWNRDGFKHIVEIGCGAGLHLQHLTTNLLGVETATGIDVNPDQIEANRNNPDFDPRIKFVAADGCQWVFENGRPNTLFVTNGGVFEYFSNWKLASLFKHIATSRFPALLFLVEPVAADHCSESNSSLPFGTELSFSHPYESLLARSGFGVFHQRLVDFESWRMLTLIASTAH